MSAQLEHHKSAHGLTFYLLSLICSFHLCFSFGTCSVSLLPKCAEFPNDVNTEHNYKFAFLIQGSV